MLKTRINTSLPENLLAEVKNYLDITYEDQETDKKLLGIIERGMNHLQTIAGDNLDFSIEESPRELLLDYCRYARSMALEVFDTNFKNELMALHIEKAVKNFEATNASEL